MSEKGYNTIIKTGKGKISTRLAGEAIAEKLDIKPTVPVPVRERFVYDINQVSIEYSIGYYRADSFIYTIEAERQTEGKS